MHKTLILLFLAALLALPGCAYRGGGGGNYGDDDDSAGDDDDDDYEWGPMTTLVVLTNQTGEDLAEFLMVSWPSDDEENTSTGSWSEVLEDGETRTWTVEAPQDVPYGLDVTVAVVGGEATLTRCYVASTEFEYAEEATFTLWLDLDGVTSCDPFVAD